MTALFTVTRSSYPKLWTEAKLCLDTSGHHSRPDFLRNIHSYNLYSNFCSGKLQDLKLNRSF